MCKALRLAAMLQVLLGVATPLTAQPRAGQELLDFVRDAHRASRESIRTCSCRVVFRGTIASTQSKTPKIESCSGRFWYSSDAVRAKVSDFGADEDWLWKDSVKKGVSRRTVNGRQAVGASRSNMASRYSGRCDAWARGLLVLNVPSQGIECAPFEQFVAHATRLTKAERRTIDGREMVVFRFFFDKSGDYSPWDVEIYFDPALNYLVRKTIYSCPGPKGNFRREDEVVQFKECAPGLFFPERLVGRSGPEGDFDFHHTTEISDIRVNEPLPPDIFRFRYPHGVYLTDSVREAEYQVDAEVAL
jgi:hypothetical protein